MSRSLLVPCLLSLLATLPPATVCADATAPVPVDAADWYRQRYAVDFVQGSAGFFDHYVERILFVRGADARQLDHASFAAALEEIYTGPWTRAGWKRSELRRVETLALGPQTTLIMTRWAMLDDAGHAVTGCALPGWNYIVVQSGGTWKIAAEIEAPCDASPPQ